MLARMLAAPAGSNPAVGSSRINTLGSMAMTPAMATRRFCPPESSEGERARISSLRPAKAAAWHTRRSISGSSNFMFRGRRRCLCTLSPRTAGIPDTGTPAPLESGCCGSALCLLQMSCPWKRTSPSVGRISPLRC